MSTGPGSSPGCLCGSRLGPFGGSPRRAPRCSGCLRRSGDLHGFECEPPGGHGPRRCPVSRWHCVQWGGGVRGRGLRGRNSPRLCRWRHLHGGWLRCDGRLQQRAHSGVRAARGADPAPAGSSAVGSDAGQRPCSDGTPAQRALATAPQPARLEGLAASWIRREDQGFKTWRKLIMPRVACSRTWQWKSQPPEVWSVGTLPKASASPSRPVSSK